MDPATCRVFNGVIPDIEISVGGVCDVFQNLNCNSAVGPDQVHPRVLKVCAHQLAVPLI